MTDHHPLADDLWERRGSPGGILVYVGPPIRGRLDCRAIRDKVRARRTLGALWSYHWDCGAEGPWFSYVCDTVPYQLETIKKKVRYYVRRGLEDCQVRPVEPEWLATAGYETYARAATRYRNALTVSREEFHRHMLGLREQPGFQMYGVFVGQALAAYGIVRQFDTYLQMCVAKFDPAFSEAMPMYALYFTVAHQYLIPGRCAIVDNGQRPLLHDTQIGDFLLRMGWRKAYSRLGLHLVGPMTATLRWVRMFREPMNRCLPGRVAAMLEGLLVAQDLARATAPRG